MQERLGWRAIALWTVVFCVHRVAVLRLGFDAAYYWEETYRLLMGEALALHWPWPLLDVQADPYSGGSLVFAALASPVVTWLGPSLIGLKSIALLWSAVGFVAWTWLVDRWFGRWPAFAFASLYVLGPPLFVVYNLIAMGSHAEVATLAGLQLLLAYRFLYDDAHPTAWLVAWGVVAGLATWFMYTAIVPFAACVAVALVAGALPIRRWPVLGAAFLVGFAPWIVATVGGAHGLDVVARTFGLGTAAAAADGAATYAQVLRYLVTKGVALALQFRELDVTVPGETHTRPLLFGQAYCVLYALAALALTIQCLLRPGIGLRLRRVAATFPEVPLLVIVPLFVAILAASDQLFLVIPRAPFFAFRVLVPFLPAMMAVIAIAVGRLPAWPRTAAFVVLGCFAGAGSWQVLAAGSQERPRLVAEARERGAEVAGHLLYYKHDTDLSLVNTRIGVMPPELRSAAYRGLGFSLAFHHPETEPVATFVDRLATVPAPFRTDALEGARLALGPGLEQVMPRAPSPHASALRTALDDLDPPKPGQ